MEAAGGSHVFDPTGRAVSAEGIGRQVTVQVTTIPALLERAGVDRNAYVVAKMGIKGSEWGAAREPGGHQFAHRDLR
jgi:hypothetical protein